MKGRPQAILFLLCFAQLMLVLDFSIVNVALPSIGEDLHLNRQGLQWVITAYALTFGGFLLVGGRAADLFGRRRMFVAGLSLFSLASLVGGFAHQAWVLIAARAVQGLGAAAVSPAIVSLIATMFPDGRPRHNAMGWLGSVSTVGFAIGMVLGGVLTSTLGWQWVMFVNVPAGLVVIAMALRFLPHRLDEQRRKGVDLLGAALVTGAATALVYALAQAGSTGWSSPLTLGPLLAAVVQGALFIAVEMRLPAPLVPLDFFDNRDLLGANLVGFMLAAASPSLIFMLTLFMQQTLRFGPLWTGMAFLPQATMAFAATRLVPRLVARIGPRGVILLGSSLLCLGLLTYTRLTPMSDYLTGILPGMFIAPVGALFGSIAALIVATTGVPHVEQGLAAGMLASSQQLGAAVGISTVVSIMGASEVAGAAAGSAASLSALPYGFMVAAMFPAAALLAGVLIIRPAELPDAIEEPIAAPIP